MAFPSQEADRFNIRLSDGLRDRLKSVAAANGRSANSEIIARLEASFDAPRALDSEVSRLLDEYVSRKVAERLAEIAKTLGGAQ